MESSRWHRVSPKETEKESIKPSEESDGRCAVERSPPSFQSELEVAWICFDSNYFKGCNCTGSYDVRRTLELHLVIEGYCEEFKYNAWATLTIVEITGDFTRWRLIRGHVVLIHPSSRNADGLKEVSYISSVNFHVYKDALAHTDSTHLGMAM